MKDDVQLGFGIPTDKARYGTDEIRRVLVQTSPGKTRLMSFSRVPLQDVDDETKRKLSSLKRLLFAVLLGAALVDVVLVVMSR